MDHDEQVARQMALDAYNHARRGNGARPLRGFSKAWWAVNGRTWMIKAREVRQEQNATADHIRPTRRVPGPLKVIRPKTKLEEAVEAYSQAYAVLQFITGSLDQLVQAQVKLMDTSENVMGLIDKLPKHYGGCRRLYELAAMLDEEKERR